MVHECTQAEEGVGSAADSEAAAPRQFANHHRTFTTDDRTLPVHALKPISFDVVFSQLFGDGRQKQRVDEFREGLVLRFGRLRFWRRFGGGVLT